MTLPSGTVTFLFTDIEGSTTIPSKLDDTEYSKLSTEGRAMTTEQAMTLALEGLMDAPERSSYASQ
jgi:class 3 adenylate cyclase